MLSRRVATSGLILLGLSLAGSRSATAQRAGRGFLFHRPVATISVRGGFALASAGSDVFSENTQQLTIDRFDFSSGVGGGDIAFWLSQRTDLQLSVMYMSRRLRSEFRDWVDQDDLPIEQTTRFQRAPITASLRWYLKPRGRSIGRFVWIPARYSLYVGAGGGAMWYDYQQTGDFVDFDTQRVFADRFASDGIAPAVQALAGFDYSLTPWIALSAEARYVWARAAMSRDFVGFDKIDLSGAAMTLGLTFRSF